MKKFFYSMVTMLMMAATAAVFTSCSDDDDDTIVVMSLGIDSMNYSGSDSEEEKELWQYISQVESAYKSALGMTSDNTLTLKNEDYKAKCAEMKQKFDSATLPTPLSVSFKYSFTYELTATGSSNNSETVASKNFSNM